MKDFILQPLRIPSGWTVNYNHFSEYDPLTESPEYLYELSEDMLQMENDRFLIDLGWYPEMDLNGRFILVLADRTRERPFEHPIERFETRDKAEVTAKIEEWAKGDI